MESKQRGVCLCIVPIFAWARGPIIERQANSGMNNMQMIQRVPSDNVHRLDGSVSRLTKIASKPKQSLACGCEIDFRRDFTNGVLPSSVFD